MADFRLTYTDCALLQSQITAFGPSRFARFDADGPGGADGWDGGHSVSVSSWLYSFDDIIKPAVAASHPSWSQDEIHTHALKIFNTRIAENARIFRDEEKNAEGMDTLWEVAEIDGTRQLVVKDGAYKGTSLNEFWEHTRQFAEEQNSPQAYNVLEHQAQLSMQTALVQGRAISAVTILSHPEDIKYVQVWEAQEDGTIITRQIDLKNTAGRHLTHEEGKSLIEKLAEKYTKNKITDDSSSQYVHVLTHEKIPIKDVKIAAQAHVSVSWQGGNTQEKITTESVRHVAPMRRLPHVDERLGEAARDTFTFATRKIISDGMSAFDTMKHHISQERKKKTQREIDSSELKRVRAFLGVPKDPETKLAKTNIDVFTQSEHQSKSKKEDFLLAKKIQGGIRLVTAMTLWRLGVKGALPVVAIGLAANELKFFPTTKKEKQKTKQLARTQSHIQEVTHAPEVVRTKEVFSRKKRKSAIFILKEKQGKKVDVCMVEKQQETIKKKETLQHSERKIQSDPISQLFLFAWAIQRLKKNEKTIGKKIEKSMQDQSFIHKKVSVGETSHRKRKEKFVNVEKKRKNLEEKRTILEYMFLLTLFMGFSRFRIDSIPLKKKENARFGNTKDWKHALNANKNESQPIDNLTSLFSAIIIYLDLIKEQGMYGKQGQTPVVIKTSKKSAQKKNYSILDLLPQSGIIFAYPS